MTKLSSCFMLGLTFLGLFVYVDLWRLSANDDVIRCEIIRYDDINEDSHLDQLSLLCDLNNRGTPGDIVTVIDRDGDMIAEQDWRSSADIQDDIWLFDYQGDGLIELIIEFYRDKDSLVADLYDIPENADHISYTRTTTGIELIDPVFPTVRVIAEDGWWSKDSVINYNLDIFVDGDVFALFGDTRFFSAFNTDGVPDFSIRVRDPNKNGSPEYDWRTVIELPTTLRTWRGQRTNLMVNVADNEPPATPLFPWPYLGNETGYLISSPSPTSHPPIQMNWELGSITTLGEFVRSRGNDAQWFIYSSYPMEEGEINTPNFETPFAWYDLAEDHDLVPELSIRTVYHWPNDPVFYGGRFPRPFTNIRYSWDQDNDGFWGYKLGLVNDDEINTTVSLPDLGLDIQMISYEELPYWVMEREWDIATFVVAENAPGIGEGIYEWDPSPWVREVYFTGNSVNPIPVAEDGTPLLRDLRFNPPKDDLASIEAGFRGEYQFLLQDVSRLYLSPIDHKLHLFGAEGGLWNIDNGSELHYSDLDQDGYINQWQFIVNGDVLSELYYAGDYIVFAEDNKLVITEIRGFPLALVDKIVPPRNHEEWVELGQLLEQHAHEFEPGDFESMIAQFDGPVSRIDGASMRDFRLTEGGFRFVLTFDDDYHLTSEIPVEGLPDSSPGEYVVESLNGRLSAKELTPPSLRIAEHGVEQGGEVYALHPETITTVIANSGLEDAHNVTIRFYAESKTISRYLIEEATIDVLGEEEQGVTIQWAPPSAGQWNVSVEVDGLDQSSHENLLLFDSVQLDIQPNEINKNDLLSLDGTQPFAGWLIPVFLGSLALAALSIFGLVFRITRHSDL